MTMMMMMMMKMVVGAMVTVSEADIRIFPRRVPQVTQVTEIPKDTTIVEIRDNELLKIDASDFADLLSLKEISITRCKHLAIIHQKAFMGLPKLESLVLSENIELRRIEAFAFADLPNLVSISITHCKHLAIIYQKAFMGLPKLKLLVIRNTGLTVLPDFTQIRSAAPLFQLHLWENVNIKRIPSNAFQGLCSHNTLELQLDSNGLTEVESHAFNGTKMNRLSLEGNGQLSRIHDDAFQGAVGPEALIISGTAVSSFPKSIVLQKLRLLEARSVNSLTKLPSPENFTHLHKANLTYGAHCCAFKNAHRKRWEPTQTLKNICSKNETPIKESPFYRAHCSGMTNILCDPPEDEFNPCENIMGTTPLRVLIWIISILTLLGNVAVLLVLLGSRSKLTVPRFLMCHLSFADLCMAVYLLVIATVDMQTRKEYYSHAIDWQTGPGCRTAGFFTVFASELSVFTLTTITLERWYTITYALRLERRLRLRHACVVMAAGWVFSCLAALLPTVGVSSYGKVSICLPMDVESAQSQVYVVSLLLLNVLAFLCVCFCYLRIYLTVRNPSSAPAHADTRVAQRMAVLIFTNFLCMAPISFFALSAALKYPLITVSRSKLLLVLFYPINSCANPFLYAFCTRTFRRDFFLLAARFGLCTTRAQIYRTESTSIQQPAWIPGPKIRHGTLYVLGAISHSH